MKVAAMNKRADQVLFVTTAVVDNCWIHPVIQFTITEWIPTPFRTNIIEQELAQTYSHNSLFYKSKIIIGRAIDIYTGWTFENDRVVLEKNQILQDRFWFD